MQRNTLFFLLTLCIQSSLAQNVGIVRKNYFSTYVDTVLGVTYEQFDSATVRLGTVDPFTGNVTPVGSIAYNLPINLNGATVDPYQHRYFIGSGFNVLTFDITSGNLLNNVPIFGALPSSSFQNYRFNPSDSTLYGLVPHNYYSMVYDSISQTSYEVLDSSQIRFASLDPETGQYTLLGNANHNNLYTLAGNSIDPFQMLYYYSAVDTLVGIDLYTGNTYSEVPILLPAGAIFENIAYSCVDTSIYGITRQNHVSLQWDSLFMEWMEVIDSTTFHLSNINPMTGEVTFLSPSSLNSGGSLTGGAYIDPGSLIYYYSTGNTIVGVSLVTGLVVSEANHSFPNGEIALDMMRSEQNCYGATRIRTNPSTGILQNTEQTFSIYPNPAQESAVVNHAAPLDHLDLYNMQGQHCLRTTSKEIPLHTLPNGTYLVVMYTAQGACHTKKLTVIH
jgi:hypothetical protein